MPDFNFSTVKSPNPEEIEAFNIATEIARKENANIIIGTDPDCDRVGVIVKNKQNEYIALNGNQIGALLVNYIITNNINSIKRAQNGDKFEMDRLIRENNGLIWSIVKRFMNRGYEVEDLYQIGCMGFIKSIKRFDTNFEVKLSTYSVPYILGEIKRFIRDDGPIKVSRSIKELNVKINELKRHYLLKTGKEITIEQICKELKVEKEDVIIAMESTNAVESMDAAANAENKDGKQMTVFEKISTGKNEEELITNKMVINQLISELKDREKEIILLRFFKEKTQTEVAKILGISQVQVSRLERKILNEMKTKLTSA